MVVRLRIALLAPLGLGILGLVSAGGGREGSKPARDDAPRPSLQELLERLKKERDGHQGELKASVEQVLRTLDLEIETRRPAGLAEQKERLVALGAECAPILVERIDPGEKPDEAAKLRARTIAQALVDQPSPAITSRLVEIARTGSPDGRANAVQALGSSQDVQRASSVLAEIFASGEGEIRGLALASLGRLGGTDSERVIGAALESGDAAIVRTCLQALAASKAAAFAPQVLKKVSATRDAASYVDAALAYYRACPDVVDKPHVLALVRLAGEVSVASEARSRILDLLSRHAGEFDSEVKKELHQLANSTTREVREGALVTLYVSGDRTARKELLAPYDDQVEKNKQWAQSFEARANVLYRIGDYTQAVRDYTRSLQLAANDPRARTDASHVGLARCYMQQGKLKDAFDELNRAPIPASDLAEIAREPVFQKLVEHPKYGKALKVD